MNTVFGPPTFYIGLLHHPKLKEYDLSSLSFTCAGAAKVPESLMNLWKDKMGIDLAVGWGGTETNCCGTWSILKNKKNPLSVGVPYIGEVKVISSEGSTLPRGQVGEILFRGLQVSKGYFNNPEETSVSFQKDGWFRTGDAGYIDSEGFLHYVDRIKDLIIASGYNIAPIEVENIIEQHTPVRDVAVIGIPHEYRGETVKAYVVLSDEYKGKISEKDIIGFCREKMAPYKLPTSVEFIAELPKNLMGKTLRRVLKDKDRTMNKN